MPAGGGALSHGRIAGLKKKDKNAMCDITKPDPPQSATDRLLNSLRAAHHASAQYGITASRWDWKVFLGGYYDYTTACAIASLISDVCAKAMPGHDAWTKPHFSIAGIGANFRPDGRAEVGDVATWEVNTPPQIFSDGTKLWTRYWTTGYVSVVDQEDVVTRVRDHSGKEIDVPMTCHILPMAQFDMPAVIADLQARHLEHLMSGCGGEWNGQFSKPRSVAGALSQYLLPLMARHISAHDVIRAIKIGALQSDRAYRPEPIDEAALQIKLDQLVLKVAARHKSLTANLLIAA